MNESDLNAIKDAWRAAPERDVERALAHPDWYVPEASEAIKEEARRRGLPVETEAGDSEEARGNYLERLRNTLLRIMSRHPTTSAGLVGVGISAIILIQPPGIMATAVPFTCAALCLLYGALVCCCWPLRKYGTVLKSSVAAAVGVTAGPCVVAVSMALADDIFLSVGADLLSGFVLAFGILAFIACLPLLMAVFLRRRYWPVYPRGYCKHCGYNLRELLSRRCPECGTAFSAGEESVFCETEDITTHPEPD